MDKNFWLQVDETQDAAGRYVGNVLVGQLSHLEPTRQFLIASKVLTAGNHATICNLVNDSLRKF